MTDAAIRGLRNPFRSDSLLFLPGTKGRRVAIICQAMKTAVGVVLLGALSSSVVVTSSIGGSLMTEVNDVRVELTSAPEAPVTDRKTTYTVRLGDAAGKPVTDARVILTGRMADGMSAATPLRPAGEPGVYRGDVLFTMGGPWELTIRVVRPTGRVEIPLQEEVARQR